VRNVFFPVGFEEPWSASAIFDAIEIIDIAWWREILLLYCKLCSW